MSDEEMINHEEEITADEKPTADIPEEKTTEEIKEETTAEEPVKATEEPVNKEPENKPASNQIFVVDAREENKETKPEPELIQLEETEVNEVKTKYDQRAVNQALAQPDRGNSLRNLFLALLALLTVGLSVGGSYLVTSKLIKDSHEKIVVYEGVETTGVTLTTSDLSPVVSNIEDSVVEVYTERVQYSMFYGEYVTSGAGSGVIYTEDGYIVTNNHVISNARNINVKLHDGTEYKATLVATDEETDLAVLKIDASGLLPAILGDSEDLKVGETVIAIGNPLGTLGGTVTTGIVSALSREITVQNQKMTLLQTNTAINPGNSGGGLFNTSGELIAIVNAKSAGEDVEGIGFAIPVNVVKGVVQDLILNGYVKGRPSIGIKCVSIESRRYMSYYNVSSYGVYVDEVTSQSAVTAGLRSGDLIIGIDDHEIASYTEMKNYLTEYKAGDMVKLTVLRGQEKVVLDIVLVEKKTN